MVVDIKKPIIFWDIRKVQLLGGRRWEMVRRGNRLRWGTGIRADNLMLDKIIL